MPCLLVTKKRYCGTMFETKDDAQQGRGIFDAKGIETVRRDSCPYVAKLEERALKLLFRTKGDVRAVRADLERQFERTIMGRISFRDFVSSGKVRVGEGAYASEASLPPSAIVSHRRGARDSRLSALNKERVPFLVVNGPPGGILREMVVHPEDYFTSGERYSINFQYYIVNLLRALARLFELQGMKRCAEKVPMVMSWFRLMRRRVSARPRQFHFPSPASTAYSISNYLLNKRCRICHNRLSSESDVACADCMADPTRMLVAAAKKVQSTQTRLLRVMALCDVCTGRKGGSAGCRNAVCELYYERMKAKQHYDDDAIFSKGAFGF